MESAIKLPCFEGIGKMRLLDDDKMIVTITKCSSEGAKYENMIGQKIEVSYFSADRLKYQIEEENFTGFIMIEDTDLSDGQTYTFVDVMNAFTSYCDEDSNNLRKSIFINTTHGGNQAKIISFEEKTGMILDWSRKEVRKFTPEELFANSIQRYSFDNGKTVSLFYHDTWTKLIRDFFSLVFC